MNIWIDADGCPVAVRDIVYRAAKRKEIETILVANRVIETPPNNKWLSSIVVSAGADVADDWIAERVKPEDIVITADIPLAARVVGSGATGIGHRGQLYTEENVRERLSMRDFMHDLREMGVQTGGPSSFGPRDKQKFANALDKLLTARQRASSSES